MYEAPPAETQLGAASRREWLKGLALMALSAGSFGTLAIFARQAYAAGADPPTVLFLRFSIAALVMVGVMLARGLPWPRGKLLAALLALGGLGYVGQSLAFFTALTMAPASLVALLLYLYPVIVTVGARVFFNEPLGAAKLGALALALAGTVLTIGTAAESPQGTAPLGIALGVGAALIYSVYIMTGSRVTPQAGPIPSSTVIMGAAALVYGAMVAARGPVFPAGAGGWLAIAGIALISTVVAIVCFFAGMERIGPVNASTLSAVEPAVTVILAALILREQVTPLQVAGGALILAAVVLLARAGAQPAAAG